MDGSHLEGRQHTYSPRIYREHLALHRIIYLYPGTGDVLYAQQVDAALHTPALLPLEVLMEVKELLQQCVVYWS